MTIGIVVSGTHYSYSDSDWEKLNSGDLGAPELVLRHIIKRQADDNQQWRDEFSFLNDMMTDYAVYNHELQERIVNLEQQQALGWETKPAKASRKKLKEAAVDIFGPEDAEKLLKGTPLEAA